jgi:penicillin-binding protein 1C
MSSLKNIKIKLSRKRIIVVSILGVLLVAYIFCLPSKLFDVPYSTVVLDRNGELLGARIAKDEQWRFPVIDTVPAKFETCIIAFEDRHFRWHWGVNAVSIFRAATQNIKAKRTVSGGSTITMQVIRLSRGNKRTFFEKIIEAILATRLEFHYSKNKILALYASHAPFGGNVVGIEAAAWRYFGHSASELSWAEAATLAVLPNAPAQMHITRNQKKLIEKRNRLLKYLVGKNKIDKSDYELAIAEALPAELQELPQTAPHLVTRYHIENCGERIFSTIDKSLQIRVENLLQQYNSEFLQSDIRNMAAVVIDIADNQVVAYCGNVNYYQQGEGNQVDCARAERSTGSILKPFLYYAMLNEGEILPRTLLPDIPLNINGYAPQNFNLKYEGAVPANEALARSLNVPFVALLKQYGGQKFYNFLKKNNIAKLPQPYSHYGLSLILGGAEANLFDITTAYAEMARSLLPHPNPPQRGGSMRLFKVSANLQVCTLPLLWRGLGGGLSSPKGRVKVGYESGAVWQVFEAIKEVNRPEEIDWRNIPAMQRVAWKTGTSFGFRDAWAVGVTPQYAVGVWVGNANGEGKPNLIGARTAAPVMFSIFEILPKNNDEIWFQEPLNQFIDADVCSESGMLRGRYCGHINEHILPAALASNACPYHVLVNLSADEKYRVSADCANENIVQRARFVLPPSWAYYYRHNHIEYQSLPPFRADCGNEADEMQFIYPQNKTNVVHLPRQLDGSAGEIAFNLAHSRSDAVVFWHIDGDYITSTSDFHTLNIHLPAGNHNILAIDDNGNSISCTIKVVEN